MADASAFYNKEAGVDPARAVATAPEKVSSDPGKPVPLKLVLAAA